VSDSRIQDLEAAETAARVVNCLEMGWIAGQDILNGDLKFKERYRQHIDSIAQLVADDVLAVKRIKAALDGPDDMEATERQALEERRAVHEERLRAWQDGRYPSRL